MAGAPARGRAGDVAAFGFERGFDRAALDRADDLVEARCLGGGHGCEPESVDVELGAFGEERRALEHVRQLADVAGPRVARERRARLGREPLRGPRVLGARAPQEVLGEQLDVAGALAQRRQRDRDRREPVVEILAEAARAHRGGEVLVGRGDELHVERLGTRAAEPAHGALVERREQLRLQRRRQEPDLVEQQAPAVHGLEEPRLRRARVGERALLEAEQLGLEQRLGNRDAVDGDERSGRTRAPAMDRVREQTFAGSGLPLDEDRREAAGRGRRAQQTLDRRARGDDRRTSAEQLRQRAHGAAILARTAVPSISHRQKGRRA